MSEPFVTAVVLAGGRGERMGTSTPKQFLDLAGSPVIDHCIAAFAASPRIGAVVVVEPSATEHRASFSAQAGVVSVVAGGDTRQASLAEGLVCIPDETAVILVHDAARPLVSQAVIDRVLDAVSPPYDGAIAAIPFEDAVKEVSLELQVLRSRSRSGLWRAQTPQAFTRHCLEDSLARAVADGLEAEDCSEMATLAGYRVKAVMGDPLNVKITRLQDLRLCESVIAARRAARG